MERNHYKTMANTILSDSNFYEQLPNDPKKMDKIKYNKILEQIFRLPNEKRNRLFAKF